MPQQSPVYFEDVESCVEDIIARVGPRIVLGIPLGSASPIPWSMRFTNGSKPIRNSNSRL